MLHKILQNFQGRSESFADYLVIRLTCLDYDVDYEIEDVKTKKNEVNFIQLRATQKGRKTSALYCFNTF